MSLFSTAQQEILAGQARGFVMHLFHLDHPDGALRLSLLPADWVDADGATWLGGALALEASEVSTRADGPPAPLQLVWSGADEALIAFARDGKIVGRRLTRLLGFADDDAAQIGDLVTVFKGWCETPVIEGDPSAPRITLTAESRLLRLSRSNPVLATPKNAARYVADPTGFEMVSGLQEKTLVFRP